jgi:hypothetical protein
MQVVLEERVVGRDHRQAVLSSKSHASVVREEWRVDMHQVDPGREFAIERKPERAAEKAPVFGIARHSARRHAEDGGIIVLRPAWIGGHDQRGLDAQSCEVGSKRADGSGNAIDAGKVDVGNEQYAHETPIDGRSDQRCADRTARSA